MKLPYMHPEQRYGATFYSYAMLFRDLALKIDNNPNEILAYCEHPAIQFILADRSSTAYERTQYLEAFAYGDPGVMLACPGPSLSGLMIRELGTNEQIDAFYQFIKLNHARTFFALTEPLKGSDASGIQCQLTRADDDHYYLNGEKCLFGNGAVGKIGIVLAKSHPGLLGMKAILITPDLLNENENWITRENLPMTGLRGSQIAYMRFNHCPIKKSNILGQHKGPIQQGMMAVIKTFNRLRTGVGALAVGQAQAVLDSVYAMKQTWNETEKSIYINLFYQLDLTRTQLFISAKQVDEDPFNSFNISISKIQATQISEQVITSCIDLLDTTVLLDNPWLAKCYRDCFAWEYMEGTSNMQLKNVFQGLSLNTHFN